MKQRPRPFRFGVVAAAARSAADWTEKARRVEALGFDTLVIPDTLGHTLSPFVSLSVAAAATTRLRLGTYVLANGLRHPLLVAKEAATLDFLSGGRFELGIGAGRPAAEGDYQTLGIEFESGGKRVAKLDATLQTLRGLLQRGVGATKESTTSAEFWPPTVQQPLPILVAGTGRRLLSLAAREANIIALGIQPNASETTVAEMIGWIQEAAGDRLSEIELNLNLMAVGGRLPYYLRSTLGQAAETLAQSDAVPVLKGGVEQMTQRLLELRDRLGISYIMVSDELMESLAPVVERLSHSQ
jgi:probable F420-dependent oxidoreductase